MRRIVRAGFPESRLDYRRLFAAVNETILPFADERVTISVAGQPRQNGWILALQWQVLMAFAAAIVLTWILLYRYFRDWRGALRPTISGGLAAIWGFGLVQLTRIRAESADARDPVPDHGARGQPFGADARPLLRGAGRRRLEGGGRAALVLPARRAHRSRAS